MTQTLVTPPKKTSRVGRVLWPIGWVALALGTAIVSYLALVIVGR